MKPTPIKKKTTLDGAKEESGLIIQSKEYQIKNNEGEEKEKEQVQAQEYGGYKSVEKKIE